MMFSELLEAAPTLQLRVVNFLAILELYKRGMVSLEQTGSFADIRIDYIEGSGELVFTESDEEQWT